MLFYFSIGPKIGTSVAPSIYNSTDHAWPYGVFFLKIWPKTRILRLLDTYASEIAKICVLWTFWPVFQLINHLFKI